MDTTRTSLLAFIRSTFTADDLGRHLDMSPHEGLKRIKTYPQFLTFQEMCLTLAPPELIQQMLALRSLIKSKLLNLMDKDVMGWGSPATGFYLDRTQSNSGKPRVCIILFHER